jgi:phenylacetate-CoA ligase
MGESMRRYLGDRGVAEVYGSYGASDLELNIGAETVLTIALRRLLEREPRLASRLLQHRGATPMIFQYHPADFFVESTGDGEILVTVCRPGYVAPKVRYNIHDLGHVLRYPDLRRVLAEEGVDVETLEPGALDLPLLFLYGRSDASVAFYGCKIPPADVQETLFRLPDLAPRVESFQICTADDDEGDKRLTLRLEVSGSALRDGSESWKDRVFDTLAAVNQDFREARRMAPAGKLPSLETHQTGTGPFAGSDLRIKREYVIRA